MVYLYNSLVFIKKYHTTSKYSKTSVLFVFKAVLFIHKLTPVESIVLHPKHPLSHTTPVTDPLFILNTKLKSLLTNSPLLSYC